MKIERMWTREAVRQMCIEHGFCTCSDNQTYSNILDFVARTAPTDSALAELAAMITAVSDIPIGETPEKFAKHVVIWWLLNDCLIYTPKFN